MRNYRFVATNARLLVTQIPTVEKNMEMIPKVTQKKLTNRKQMQNPNTNKKLAPLTHG